MRLMIVALIFGVLFAANTHAEMTDASKKTKVHKHKSIRKAKKKVVAVKKGQKHELQTDVKFDDSVLHGQYQTPDEALARVENEKALTDLLGVRKHFKDRLATASETE